MAFCPSGMAGDALDIEKPIVFKHEEIFASTDNFSDSNLLGHGQYGSVYYGVLRDQVSRASFQEKFEFLA